MTNPIYAAYTHIDAGNIRNARSILESVLDADPTNVEAWEVYMQISDTCEELDFICNQAFLSVDFDLPSRESILDYYYFLRQKMKDCPADAELENVISFELVDQFTYTLKDQSPANSAWSRNDVNVRWGFAWLLDKIIAILFFVLLAIGLKLTFAMSNFGYWIMVVLAFSVFIKPWTRIFPVLKTDKPSKESSSKKVNHQGDAVSRQVSLPF